MNKIIALLLILGLSFGMIACTTNHQEADKEKNMKVLNLYENSYLVLEDKQAMIGQGELITIDVKDNQNIDIGKIYQVSLENEIASSYPPQAKAESIMLSEDTKIEPISLETANRIKLHLPEKSYLIDVRTPEEFAEGHVPDAILIPLDTLEDDIQNHCGKDDVIIVYCRSGSRSKNAASILKNLGYFVVLDAGGIMYYDGDLAF